MKSKLFITLLVALSILLTGIVTALAAVAPVYSNVAVQQDGFDLVGRIDDYLTNELPPAWGNVTAEDLSLELLENPLVLLDVRRAEEWDENGHIEGATLVTVTELTQHLDLLPADLDTPIVTYCARGTRGLFAMITLQVMGYTNVRNLGGGIGAWIDAGFSVSDTPVADMEFEVTGGPELDPALVDAMTVFLTENIPAGWGQVAVDDYAIQSLETDYFLLDVRRQDEWDENGHIEGATLITLDTLGQHLDEIPTDMPVMVYCARGTRGAFGAIMLEMLGYEAYNLSGGFGAWVDAGYDVVTD